MPIVAETEKPQIAQIRVWNQEREFLTDRRVGSSSNAEKFA
jgi:hypothetical protein